MSNPPHSHQPPIEASAGVGAEANGTCNEEEEEEGDDDALHIPRILTGQVVDAKNTVGPPRRQHVVSQPQRQQQHQLLDHDFYKGMHFTAPLRSATTDRSHSHSTLTTAGTRSTTTTSSLSSPTAPSPLPPHPRQARMDQITYKASAGADTAEHAAALPMSNPRHPSSQRTERIGSKDAALPSMMFSTDGLVQDATVVAAVEHDDFVLQPPSTTAPMFAVAHALLDNTRTTSDGAAPDPLPIQTLSPDTMVAIPTPRKRQPSAITGAGAVEDAIATEATDPDTAPTTRRIMRRRIWIVAVLPCLLVVLAIATATVCTSQQCSNRKKSATTALDNKDNDNASTLADQIASYVNSITMLDRTIATIPKATTATALAALDMELTEELALYWLMHHDPLVEQPQPQLVPNTTSRRFRLRQRYALLTLYVQFSKVNNERFGRVNTMADDECQWMGVSCQMTTIVENGTAMELPAVTAVNFRQQSFGTNTTLPTDWGLLSTLEYVDFNATALSGSLPTTIGRWTRLRYFGFDTNRLTGTLPSSIGQWTDIQVFNVGANQLTGTLPNDHESSLSAWTRLDYFNVWNNALTGSVLPRSSMNWTNVTYLNFGSNQFSSSLPTFVGRFSNLQILSIQDNQVTGSLPIDNGMDQWTRLQDLYLDCNQLSGSLPKSIGTLWTDLGLFSVANNRLTGPIPSSIVHWSKIHFLYLQSNWFSGLLPTDLCQALNATLVDLVVDCINTVAGNCSCCSQCL